VVGPAPRALATPLEATGVPGVIGSGGLNSTLGAAIEMVDVALDALVAIAIDIEQKGARD
jgi:hypothetical protein